jgi:hypothetical protein
MNDTNWSVNNKKTVTDADIKALEKAKKIEAENDRNGFKWIKLKPNLAVHVPCDEDGNITEKGRRIIEAYKENL